ncbi:hypothetical protein DFJ74DRAFT_713063 [Hyaloraphidium curvatum]|nr:hypothetical protein DFJ74DRAFT_713063 [Hyaloraphidium curvatum]
MIPLGNGPFGGPTNGFGPPAGNPPPQAWFRKQRWTELGIPTLQAFLDNVVIALFRSRDANNLLLQLHSWQASDVAAGGFLEEALEKIKAR